MAIKHRAAAVATVLLVLAAAYPTFAQEGAHCYPLFDAGVRVTAADDLRRILDSDTARTCQETTQLLELRLEALSADDADPEARLFNSAVRQNSSRALEAFKQQYPQGRYAELATQIQQQLLPRSPRG